MTLVLQLLWLALPLIASGLVHLAVMKLDLLPALRRLPLDGGCSGTTRPGAARWSRSAPRRSRPGRSRS
jgi:hypothetical protein